MGKRFVVVTLVLSIIFEVYRIAVSIVSISNFKLVLADINSDTPAYEQVTVTLMHCCTEIVLCCVLIILSVIACVALLRGKRKDNQANVL